MIDLKLTEEEAEVLLECVDRRRYRLEECGLTDSRCYPLLTSVSRKIKEEAKEKTASR